MEEKFGLYRSDIKSQTIYDRVLSYINKKYDIRFNIIALELEIKLKTSKSEWQDINMNSLLIELVQSGNNINMNKLETLVKSDYILKYNPFWEYFSSLPSWDGIDHISHLCSLIRTTEDNLFAYHFEKWITRSVKCALEEGKVNKQCLVLYNTIQNSGKSTFLQFLIPNSMKKYYTEDISVDKDGLIALCKSLIVNIEEMSIMSKTDINILKAFISKNSVNARLPYARKTELMSRTCSFVGSTNKIDLLSDESGSVRWLIFEVLHINFKYSSEINIDNVWAQAYFNAYERKNYNPELTSSDIIENEKRNEKYSIISMEQEIISAYFEKSTDSEHFLTATDIVLAMNNALGLTLTNIKVGKALTGLKYQRIKHPKLQTYGYLIKRKE
ncbi:virulence-associated E family protein [Chryseobacterium piscium]|uniref:Virulence-associated E family protein n=1 Tax=Chryseobacterium piscium TaxID=333702 RepID=A0A3D9BP05_9FLAO|nr:VapE domain-containing protein [Chryseobacterium piscium]REC55081.1 virulence-associated E family protein [Chryseobacterium piscium]